MTQIELNKTYHFTIKNYSFGDLSTEAMNEICQDGRVASHLLEPQLVHWFPELIHIKGCKDHDHTDHSGQKYDAKNFTKGGLRFKPSNMIGTGRTFNYQGMVDKAQDMIYIACDIIDFPQIKVIFKEGMDLVREYPNGEIKKSQREVLFG
jgi:hypothetical protein